MSEQMSDATLRSFELSADGSHRLLASEIRRQQARIERLEAALKPFAEIKCHCHASMLMGHHEVACLWAWLEDEIKAAAEALEVNDG